MKTFYLLHNDVDGCGIPLLSFQYSNLPKTGDPLPTFLTCLDGITMIQHGDVWGPCQHCLAPFSMIPQNIITRKDYRQRRPHFRITYPGYERLTHKADVRGQFHGNGAEERVLTIEKPIRVLKVKRIFPKEFGSFNVGIYRFSARTQEILLDAEDNQQDAYYQYIGFKSV